MADGIEMQFGEMESAIGDLNTAVVDIISRKGDMIRTVNTLCESWKSAASDRHREEFDSVGKSIDKLSEMAQELIQSVTNYNADMHQIEDNYS